MVPNTAAPVYLRLAVTPAAAVSMVEKVLDVVYPVPAQCNTPTLSSAQGAKKTLVPTAAAP